jgi:hypothetical protein
MGWVARVWGGQLRLKGSVKILVKTVEYHESPGLARLYRYT